MCKLKHNTKTIYWQCVGIAKIEVKSSKNFGGIMCICYVKSCYLSAAPEKRVKNKS